MFFIPVLLKPFGQPSIRNLGILVSDNFSLSSEITNIEEVSIITGIEDHINFLEDNFYRLSIVYNFQFLDNLYVFLQTVVVDYLFKLSYAQITSITLDDFLSARFLPDYHVIEYLAKDAQVDRYSVSKILVALSNLLRECKNYDVRQINAISLRIHKATMNDNKTVFVITEY